MKIRGSVTTNTMIKEKIQQDLIEAMKQNNELVRDTLRLLSNGLAMAEKEKQAPLEENEELVVLKRAAKQRRESIEAYQDAGRKEQAQKEQAELEIIKKYLPSEMSDQELEKIVREKIQTLGATDPSKMGQMIGAVMAQTGGQADGKKVSEMVRNILKNENSQ